MDEEGKNPSLDSPDGSVKPCANVETRSAGIIAVRAPVAQWIERRPPEPKVAGSNPVGRASTNVRRLEGQDGATARCAGRAHAPILRCKEDSMALFMDSHDI